MTTATPLATQEFPGFADLFLGMMPGCIGEVSALALLVGAAYLLVRRVITWHIPVAFLATCAACALVLGGAPVHVQLLSGGIVLGACFMATDYVTSPITHGGQIVYGIGCGVLTVAFRYFGSYPEGVTFAILIMNCCIGFFDKIGVPKRFGAVREKKKKGGEAA